MAFQDYGVGNLPLTENELPSDQLDIFTPPIKNNAIISSKFSEIRIFKNLNLLSLEKSLQEKNLLLQSNMSAMNLLLTSSSMSNLIS